jgi:hypothetical protein
MPSAAAITVPKNPKLICPPSKEPNTLNAGHLRRTFVRPARRTLLAFLKSLVQFRLVLSKVVFKLVDAAGTTNEDLLAFHGDLDRFAH